jgi:hypothetical protein
VKKCIAIFFTAVFILGTTEAHQLFRLPLLVSHYITHTQEDKSISVLQFLSMHYSGEIVYDADYEQDMQLPFKQTSDAFLFFVAFAAMALPLTLQFKQPQFLWLSIRRAIFTLLQNSLFASFFWQPPRPAVA